MTSSDQPQSNSPKCEMCGQGETFVSHGDWCSGCDTGVLGHIEHHTFKPAPLSNSDDAVKEARDQVFAHFADYFTERTGANVPDPLLSVNAFEAAIRADEAASRLSAITPGPEPTARIAALLEGGNDAH